MVSREEAEKTLGAAALGATVIADYDESFGK